MGCSERQKEIKRRRQRKQKINYWKSKAEKANASEKAAIAQKIRNLTPGAESLIKQMDLES